MLDSGVIKKIEDFVSAKPRSIQEISHLLKKNWRTADRYVDYIKQNFGTIATRTFREGTRGALKIVYWASFDKRKGAVFQKTLAEQIELYRKKGDFSPFDIYQHVPDKNKKASVEKVNDEDKTDLIAHAKFINNTKKQFLSFSGNLSWINLKNKDIKIYDCMENLVKKGIPIKIVSRVDIASLKNVEKLLELNFKYGKELIEIRHREQPLRASISDNKIARIKEIKEPTGKIHELQEKTFIFYTIKDKEWLEWLSKIFWNLFSKSIDSKKRIEQIKNL